MDFEIESDCTANAAFQTLKITWITYSKIKETVKYLIEKINDSFAYFSYVSAYKNTFLSVLHEINRFYLNYSLPFLMYLLLHVER